MPKESKRTRTALDGTIISQSVALGVVVVVLGDLSVRLGLHLLPLIGTVFQFFTPVAFVVLMTYFRSEQKTRPQAVAEGIFAGCIMWGVLTLMMEVIRTLTPPVA